MLLGDSMPKHEKTNLGHKHFKCLRLNLLKTYLNVPETCQCKEPLMKTANGNSPEKYDIPLKSGFDDFWQLQY